MFEFAILVMIYLGIGLTFWGLAFERAKKESSESLIIMMAMFPPIVIMWPLFVILEFLSMTRK